MQHQAPTVYLQQIRTLEDRVEQLAEENRQLRGSLLPAEQFKFPREWGLSASETAILSSLYISPKGGRSHHALHVASNLSGYETDENIVKVWISRIRKKLRPAGIDIDMIWAYGYELTVESKQVISEALSERSAA